MDEEWLTIKRIFQTALEMTGNEREKYLKEECRNNPKLLQTVLSMLKSSETFDDFLENDSNNLSRLTTDILNEDLLEGKILGKYKLLRKIGEGGMGVVYLAERADKSYEALTAVKIITYSLNRKELIERFLLERQTLANLNHPYIARLFDGGSTKEGFPYIVMEYAEGIPLDEFCESKKLKPKERIELFLKVCEAISYAHQNLVIHRDLKPDNILITKEGRPVVLDFGIAKIIDPDTTDLNRTHTAASKRLLTPNYAAPEQIKGEPTTTRTDVYSLGMILYKLLTGSLPFDLNNLSLSQIEETICSKEPIKPSVRITQEGVNGKNKSEKLKLMNFIKSDLDLIILKALRKEPERRYASVEQFMDDLKRYLNGYPVTARPATLKYKAGKFIQRHKAGVFSVCIIVLLLLAGVGGILWQASIAEKQRDYALKEANKSEKVLRFLQSMLSSPDPYESGKDITVLELLSNISRQIEEKFATQPEVEIEIRHTLGNTYLELGKYKQALKHFKREFQICKDIYGINNEKTANALEHIALTNHYLGNFFDAKQGYIKALNILKKLSNVNPDIMGGALNDYATYLTDEANYTQAEKYFRESLNLIIKTKGEYNEEAFAATNNIAIVLRRQNKLDEAAELYKKALSILDSISNKLTPAKAIILGNIGKIYLVKKDFKKAENYYRNAMNSSLILYGNDNPMLFNPILNLGILYYNTKDYKKAEELIRKSIQVLHAENNKTNPQLAIAYISLARVLFEVNKNVEANQLFRQAIEIRKKVFGKKHKLSAETEIEYGKYLLNENNYIAAKHYLLSAYEGLSADSTQKNELIDCTGLLVTTFKLMKDSVSASKYSMVLNQLKTGAAY